MERRSRIMSSWMFVALSILLLVLPLYFISLFSRWSCGFPVPLYLRASFFQRRSEKERGREWDRGKNKRDVEKNEMAGKSISWNQFDLKQRLCIGHTKNENECAPVYRPWIIGESSCRIRNKRSYCGTYLYRPIYKTDRNWHGGVS